MSARQRAVARARDAHAQIVTGWAEGGVQRDEALRPRRDAAGALERVAPVDGRLVVGDGLTFDFRGGRRG